MNLTLFLLSFASKIELAYNCLHLLKIEKKYSLFLIILFVVYLKLIDSKKSGSHYNDLITTNSFKWAIN